MQILNHNPMHRGGRLATAFFIGADEQGATVYLDSFGQPYFFHRTRVDLLGGAEDQGKERVLCIKLLDVDRLNGPSVVQAVTKELAHALFPPVAQGQHDALFKELYDKRHSYVLGADEPGKLDLRKELDFYYLNADTRAVLHIKRYALD